MYIITSIFQAITPEITLIINNFIYLFIFYSYLFKHKTALEVLNKELKRFFRG